MRTAQQGSCRTDILDELFSVNHEIENMRPPRLVARVDKKRLYWMLALAVCAFFASYFLASRFEFVVFAVCIVIALVYGIRLALRDDARGIIDERGVLDSRLTYGIIRWSDIARVYVSEYQHNDHVCLELTNPEHYLKRHSIVTRGLLKFHQARNKISPFNINTRVLDVSTDEVYRAILEGWRFYRET